VSPSKESSGSLIASRYARHAVQCVAVVTVQCECRARVKVDVQYAKEQLIKSGDFAFGRHVSDPRAFVMRFLKIHYGWIGAGGRLGKSTLTMVCPKCREKLPGLPVDPDDQAK
jgi:hypothetical protein